MSTLQSVQALTTNNEQAVSNQPAIQATPETRALQMHQQQQAVKLASQTSKEAPLVWAGANAKGVITPRAEAAEQAQAAEPAQGAEQARGAEDGTAKSVIIVLLLVLIIVGVILIFRISGMHPPVPTPQQNHDKLLRDRLAMLRQPVSSKTSANDLCIANPRFLELAIENRLLTHPMGADLAERFHGNDFAAMLQLLVEQPNLKDTLGKLWGDSIGFTYANPEMIDVQPEMARQIPREFAETNRIVPLYSFGGSLTIATSNPQDKALEMLIANQFDIIPSFVFAFPDEIADTIAIAYQSEENLKGIATTLNAESKVLADHPEHILTVQDLSQLANSNSVIEFVNGLILLAMHEKASDIHIEPDELSVRIRFRIDGILREKVTLAQSVLLPLTSRLKLMSGCDIAERRHPQDGRITFAMARHKVDIRVSMVPTLCGEKVVLRLLGSTFSRGIPNITDMDFSVSVLKSIKRVAKAPNGVFFITGPTGSGKTTTLYSVLKYINTPGINIMTVEDPVEYRLPGINQVQINTNIELYFATVLRSFLRQDPNIILIGEIRDKETARIASQAALTGHLVFATMHTNNALQAVSRMIDIGVEPFLVAPSLIALMAQRLVRRICSDCIEKYPVPKSVLDDNFEWDGVSEVFFSRGKGCPRCHGTGYSGRLALHELFILNSATREKIAQNASVLIVEQVARESGFQPLRYDGLKKVLRGLTTIEEVDRVTYQDG